MSEGAGDARDPHRPSAELARLSTVELRRLMDEGAVSSVELTTRLLERIGAIDRSGPSIRSVLRVAGDALDQAAARDEERSRPEAPRPGPLHGIPVLVKDNIDTAGALGTTAGSFALDTDPPHEDAPVVALLRRAGAVIVGKSNLSEWANFRGRPASSGWSAVGGQTRNPYALDRSPGGSSSGSGAAVAAGLVPLAVGTETDGSIICPAAACGIVGLKPTVGLVSRTGIVPISASQDTAGPMARSVTDAAILLGVLASGDRDPEDAATSARPKQAVDYFEALQPGLRGIRVGVVRDDSFGGYHAATDHLLTGALDAFKEAGGDVVGVEGFVAPLPEDELTVLLHEFSAGVAAYLARRARRRRDGGPSLPKGLADVVLFNESCADELLAVFPQDQLEQAAAAGGVDDAGYLAARDRNWQRSRGDGADALFRRCGLDALVAASMPPAWLIDHVAGDHHSGGCWGQAAVAGYPSVNVPIGTVHGLPVGITIWGPAWSEAMLLRIAYALEQQLALGLSPAYVQTVGYLA